jgi:hypothetical protein
MVATQVRDDLEARGFRLSYNNALGLVITPMNGLTQQDISRISEFHEDLVFLVRLLPTQGLSTPPPEIPPQLLPAAPPRPRRGLRAFEAAGLVTVQHQPGSATVVTVLRWAT